MQNHTILNQLIDIHEKAKRVAIASDNSSWIS
jgi:hypothetical protein